MNDLEEHIPCRKAQIDLLTSLLGQDDCVLPCSIFLYGHSGTGKTLVTTAVLQKLGILTSHVCCIEFYTARVMYETILNQLSGTVPSGINNYTSYASCDNLGDFVRHIRNIGYSKGNPRMAILLEHSERLRDCDANILPVLCRLQELTQDTNIVVIFSSTLPIDKFRATTGFMEPVVIHFPQYTKDELVDILLKQRPSTHSEKFYKNYVNLVLSVFYLATKGLPELKHQVQLNFKSYCEPLEKGEAEEHDIRLLWRNIEPQLKKAMSSVYLREVSSAQYERMQQLTETTHSDQSYSKAALTNKMELPYYTKFLLIAAYLASYNPARTDRRFFMKHHGKQRKTQAMIKAKERSSNQLVGPKPFPLDRLLAIFYSIVEDKVTPTANIFSQISSLVTLRLVTQVGGDDQLDAPKYKCAVTLDFIRSVARMVSFDVVRYLYDYA
ncbi:origin recognition complex subunit 5 [Procambarus clarkii]|uniref:origin recognition complex subunit 5 n=1 Tax=Procambarus clarkii TaxID=6728 RepID=UPI001E674F0E|nr:origin recognition complex subunit 5-like isoform X2 [Procambarus clarkii]XP_045618797.1 origin recognition complex subunit 5-like isoform X2 [Procambarus clarkii]